MDEQMLRELETAAQLLLASPNVVSDQQREAAASVFLAFRKTKSPYNLCRQILENTRVDYVLFEVAQLLKEALIREWSFLQENDIISLRQYLLQYIIERPTLSPYVRQRILQVIAIMVKRGSVEDFGANRGLILNEVEQLIINGDHPRKILGCSILSSLIQEYAITVKSSDVGLTWETHYKAKKQFECTDLKRIFQFCCQALNGVSSSNPPYSDDTLALLKHLLAISESILTWAFVSRSLPKRLISMFESVQDSEASPSLRLSLIWKEAILDPRVVNLFFTVYWKIRLNPQLSHHALSCLVQLASVNGAVFVNKESRLQYITNYIQGFVNLVTSIEILDREALGISNILPKLLTFYQPSLLTGLPSALLQSFLEEFTKLTCNFAEGAAAEETICADDRLYMEAFDHMLEAWMTVLNDSQQAFSKEFCKQASCKIFDVYLKCHLSPPDGSRGVGRELDQEEYDENDDPDRIKFKDQLQAIGVFGRQSPEHSLPLLSKLLEARTSSLSSRLEKLHQQAATISDSGILNSLFEDLHWLLLVSGHVISMDSEGETAMIPSDMMRYSISQANNISVDTSLRLLAAPSQTIDQTADGETKSDHIIRLVAAVFRLCYVFKNGLEVKLGNFLSPEVECSLLWFLRRWSLAYLLPDEKFYAEMSMALLTAFGRDSEGGAWTINYLLKQVELAFIYFNSETNLAQDAVNLFISLMDSKEKARFVLKSEGLMNILQVQSNLPYTCKRGIYKGLTLAAIALEDATSKAEYWARILKPLQDRFKNIICQDNFNRIYQEESIKSEILDILECFIGVAQGSHTITVQAIFQYIGPILSESSTLIGVYRNYQLIVEMILNLYCECARCLICYLPQSDSRKIYDYCLQTIQTYARCNGGRLSLESDSQDETFKDILLLMELLTNLLSKDLIDLSPPELPTEGERQVTAADVCLYGLNIIMPLMTMELLKYPSLCLQYYKMITFVCEIFPEKVSQLPNELLAKVLHSVEIGLTAFGQEIVLLCCDFIQVLGSYVYLNITRNETPNTCLKPFLKMLMTLILSRQISSDLVPNTSVALFVLICCYQQEYQTLVEQILSSQQDSVIGERLAKAFNELTSNIQLTADRYNRLRFRDNFSKFIVDVHGFLHVR